MLRVVICVPMEVFQNDVGRIGLVVQARIVVVNVISSFVGVILLQHQIVLSVIAHGCAFIAAFTSLRLKTLTVFAGKKTSIAV